jgi:hypothetical protein
LQGDSHFDSCNHSLLNNYHVKIVFVILGTLRTTLNGHTSYWPCSYQAVLACTFLPKTNTFETIVALFKSSPDVIWCVPSSISVRRGMSKGVEDGTPETAVSGVAYPLGVEGKGLASLSETLRSPWPPIAIRLCLHRFRWQLVNLF